MHVNAVFVAPGMKTTSMVLNIFKMGKLHNWDGRPELLTILLKNTLDQDNL